MSATNKKAIIATASFLIANIILIIVTTASIEPHKIESQVKQVYMICDVYDTAVNGEQVLIDIELPNGELLTKQMNVNDDLPEEFNEVVIQTSDLDDYTTYKIVGMR